MKRLIVFVVAIWMCPVSPSHGTEVTDMLRKGIEAYKQGDYVTALQIFYPLAKQGKPSAQYLLGSMYLYGQGVAQNDTMAVVWFLKVAKSGEPHSQNYLCKAYTYGIGTEENPQMAAKWCLKAAYRGDVFAQKVVGLHYETGEGGLPQSYIDAHMWYNLASAQGDEEAKSFRIIVEKSMTVEQIIEAQRRAVEWSNRRATQ